MAKAANQNKPICIAILAMGGQGGGVLSGWLTRLAESAGWVVQATSVPGVAQRTGTTIYYLEIIKPKTKARPVLGLMPSPGHVDIVIAVEWMEAGRAIQRGLVSPDLTTLLASTHRGFAVAEKIVPGDGTADTELIEMLARAASKQFFSADLQKIAENHDSVISASTFGALAATGALPFASEQFEQAVKQTGVGVNASLKAFAAGFDAIQNPDTRKPAEAKDAGLPILAGGSTKKRRQYQNLRMHVIRSFPKTLQPMVMHGFNRVIDFQNIDYGKTYLDTLERFHAFDRKLDGSSKGFALTESLAKYLANAMAYQDVIRVADLKARLTRFDRLRADAKWQRGQILTVTEFLHPRIEELTGLLPHAWRKSAHSRFMQRILRLLSGGKRIRTDTVTGFLMLYVLGGLKFYRPATIRHHQEMRHTDSWLRDIKKTASKNYDLAVEIIKCRRLIKGYSDTHARGISKYDQVMRDIGKIANRKDAARQAQQLRQAALSKV